MANETTMTAENLNIGNGNNTTNTIGLSDTDFAATDMDISNSNITTTDTLRISSADETSVDTANAIESLNSVIRKAIKELKIFSQDQSALKVIYLAIESVSANGPCRSITGVMR